MPLKSCGKTEPDYGDLPDGFRLLVRDDDNLCSRYESTVGAAKGSSPQRSFSSVAAFSEGRHAQAFPTFGSERTGAPVVSFCRISDAEIRVREPITEPDALIVQDPTLLHQVDLFAGLKPDGYLLINSVHSFDELGLGEFAERFRKERLLTVPATDIAREHLGRPLPNAALLGGFAAVSGVVSLESVVAAIREKFAGERRRRQRRGGRGRVRVRAGRDQGALPCVGRSRAPRPSPPRSRSAAPR